MKTRHEGPVPEGKRACRRCEGWGVTHYSAEEIGKPVVCSACDGEGLEDLPPPPVYPTVEEEFNAWWGSTPILRENKRNIAEKAWKAAQERYGNGD